jgi:hypothetical protein
MAITVTRVTSGPFLNPDLGYLLDTSNGSLLDTAGVVLRQQAPVAVLTGDVASTVSVAADAATIVKVSLEAATLERVS